MYVQYIVRINKIYLVISERCIGLLNLMPYFNFQLNFFSYLCKKIHTKGGHFKIQSERRFGIERRCTRRNKEYRQRPVSQGFL